MLAFFILYLTVTSLAEVSGFSARMVNDKLDGQDTVHIWSGNSHETTAAFNPHQFEVAPRVTSSPLHNFAVVTAQCSFPIMRLDGNEKFCVSAQPANPPVGLQLQPNHTSRVEEQGRGFVVTCRIPDGLKGSNLRWTQGQNRQEINAANGKSLSVTKKPTSIVLIFDNVTTENAGRYTCLANIEGLAEESRVDFDLTVYEGINFDSVKLNQAADIGTDYTVTCDIKGNPAPSVSWKRIVPIPNGGNEKYKVTPEGLTIRGVTRADEGLYFCEATQMVGFTTSGFRSKAITLDVNYPPEFNNTDPSVTYSFLSGDIKLNCQASGHPPPQYDWGYYESSRFMDIPLSEFKDRKDFENPSRSFVVKNMSDSSQFREYICRARNALGEAEKRFTIEEVDQPPPPMFNLAKVSSNQIHIHVTPNETAGPLQTIGYRALIRTRNGSGWENATIVDFENGTVHIVDSLFHNTWYEIIFASRNPVGLGQFSEIQTARTKDISGSGAASLTPFTVLCILICSVITWRTAVISPN